MNNKMFQNTNVIQRDIHNKLVWVNKQFAYLQGVRDAKNSVVGQQRTALSGNQPFNKKTPCFDQKENFDGPSMTRLKVPFLCFLTLFSLIAPGFNLSTRCVTFSFQFCEKN